MPNNLQLGIYALALSILFPEKTIRAELYYLRSGRRKFHVFSKEDIENVKIKLLDSINQIIEDTSFAPIQNERICSFCEHAKSKACATGYSRLKRMGKV